MSDSDILAAARALVTGEPLGARRGAIGHSDGTMPWWCYEWDYSYHCIACSSGSYHDGVQSLADVAAFPHAADFRAMVLERAVLEDRGGK